MKIKAVGLFLIITSICFGQVQKHHNSVIARKNLVVAGLDTIPSQFTFTDVTDVALSSWNEAYIVVAGCDSARFTPAATDSIKDGALSTYDVTPIWVVAGDTLYTSEVASGSNSTETTSTVNAANETVTDVFSVTTIAESESGQIFVEDFESYSEGDTSGQLTNWDLYSVDSLNSITIVIDTVNPGGSTKAALYEWGGVYNDALVQIDPAGVDATKVYFRCYIRIGHFFRGVTFGNTFVVVAFYDGGTEVARAFVRTGNTDENPDFSFHNWRVWARGDAGHGELDGTLGDGHTHNTWLRFELGWERGTSSDGWATIRVDGDSIAGVSGVDNAAYFVDRIRVGAYSNVPLDSSKWFIDDIVVDSTGWVGAKP